MLYASVDLCFLKRVVRNSAVYKRLIFIAAMAPLQFLCSLLLLHLGYYYFFFLLLFHEFVFFLPSNQLMRLPFYYFQRPHCRATLPGSRQGPSICVYFVGNFFIMLHSREYQCTYVPYKRVLVGKITRMASRAIGR